MADMDHENTQSYSCSKCKMPLADPTDYFEKYGYSRHAIVLILVITVFLILLAIKAYIDNLERNKSDTSNLEKIESDKKSINQHNSNEETVNVEDLLSFQYFQYVNSILMAKSQFNSKEIKFDVQDLKLNVSNDQMGSDSNFQRIQTQVPAATYINFNQHSHHLRNTL